MTKTLTHTTIALFIAVSALLAYSFTGAWLAPPADPPSENATAPINVGPVAQVKAGSIGAEILAASSSVWSDKYCNSKGEKCINSDNLDGLGTLKLTAVSFKCGSTPSVSSDCEIIESKNVSSVTRPGNTSFGSYGTFRINFINPLPATYIATANYNMRCSSNTGGSFCAVHAAANIYDKQKEYVDVVIGHHKDRGAIEASPLYESSNVDVIIFSF